MKLWTSCETFHIWKCETTIRPCFEYLNLGSIWAGGSGIKKNPSIRVMWKLADPLASFDCSPDWSIANIISKILCVEESFLSCLVCWVKRECNSVAHAAAKFSLGSFESFCFNKLSIPKVLWTACEVDCSSFFSVWIKLKIMKKKKNNHPCFILWLIYIILMAILLGFNKWF